jgi:hypothetical protein
VVNPSKVSQRRHRAKGACLAKAGVLQRAASTPKHEKTGI